MKQLILLTLLFFSSFSVAQNNFLQAENYFRNSEYEKATQLYEKLYAKSPYNTSYLKRLISCYQETNKFLVAESLLKKRIQKNSKLTYINVLLGYNYERQGQKETATVFYEKALNVIDIQPNYGGVTASLFKENNLLSYAIKAYEKTMLKNPNANYSFQVAQIYGEQGEFEKMFQAYVNLVDKNKNYLATVKRFASRYITDDSENENNILFRKTLLRKSISKPKAVWNFLLSWLFTQQNDYQKAFVQEKALYQRDSSGVSNIADLGIIAFENNAFEAANTCFQFILENSDIIEEKLNALLYKTKIFATQKNPETEKLFQQIFTDYGKNTRTLLIQIEYADYLAFKKNSPDDAKKVLEKAIRFAKSKFQKARIKLKLGDILVFTGRFNKALIYFSQIQTQLKNHQLAQQARFKVAKTSYFKGDFTWAKAQLKILKGSTTQLIANDAVNLFLIITDNEPVDSIPSGLIQYAKADLLAFQNKNQEAITLLTEVTSKYKGMPIEDEALYKQAKLFVLEQEYENAITNFENIIEMDAEGILVDDAYYYLAELYNNQLKDSEKASEYYQKIIFDHTSSIYLVDARKKYRKLRGDTIN